MHDWCETLARELGKGRAVVMVTAVEVLGSAPCAPGAKLIVSTGDAVLGTIGGGNLEYTAIDQARKLAASDRPVLLQSLPLGPVLSQCCGGRVTLLFERFAPEQSAWFAEKIVLGGQFTTTIDPKFYRREHSPGSSLAVLSELSAGSLADGNWVEPVRPQRRQVVIFGGGHIGKALINILAEAPCDVLVVDPRGEVSEDLASVARVIATSSPAAMDQWWRRGSIAVILTHSHELDYTWTRELLRRGDYAWCGLIGSKTKRTRFHRRLRSEGIPDHRISDLVCPIGLPGLNSKHPGVVAISTAAQLLPYLANLSQARAGQSCDCALPGSNQKLESVK